MTRSTIRIIGVFLLLTSLGACSTLSIDDDPQRHQSSDPFEGLNRSIYTFNDKTDKLVLKPVAKVYDAVLPKPAKKGVSNFFSNLNEPLNVVNNLLQGKLDRALASTFRFTVNSTIGILGLFDVAQSLDVNPAREDFGQTMAAWGVQPGPYLMLPFLGPSNLRDGLGRLGEYGVYYPINEITDSNSGRIGLSVTDLVSGRAKLLGTDEVLDSQLDPYAFLKKTYENQRVDAIYDGSAPTVEEDFDF